MRDTLAKYDPTPALSPDRETDPRWDFLVVNLHSAYQRIASPAVRRRLVFKLLSDIISAERMHASRSPLESAEAENDSSTAQSRAGQPWDDPNVAAQMLLCNPAFEEDDPFLAYARVRRAALEAATRAFEQEWDSSKHPRGGENPGWFRTTSGVRPGEQRRQYRSGSRAAGATLSHSPHPANDADAAASGWRKDEVVALLMQSEAGKTALATLNSGNVEVRNCEKVEAQVRFKNGDQWGPYEKKQWGAMTTTAAGGKKTIHMPKNVTPEQAAFLLVHEAAHAAGGGEREAYEAETGFAIESPNRNVQRLARQGLVKTDGGEKVVDKAGLERFIRANYGGWYSPDPNMQYKTNEAGKITIEYGVETVIPNWRK